MRGEVLLNVLTELKNRSLNDILIAQADGLKRFRPPINAVYRKARIQLCTAMVHNSLHSSSLEGHKARHPRPESDFYQHGRRDQQARWKRSPQLGTIRR